jgi:hypothetical protein
VTALFDEPEDFEEVDADELDDLEEEAEDGPFADDDDFLADECEDDDLEDEDDDP